MRIKGLILILLFTCCFGLNAQTEQLPQKTWVKKNVVTGTIGFFGLYGAVGLNYERFLLEKQQGIVSSLWIRAGIGEWGGWTSGGPYRLIGLTALSGRKNSHIELGFGLTRIIDDSQEDHTSRYFQPMGVIGYRLHNPSKHFMFRIGMAFPESAYLGIGYSF